MSQLAPSHASWWANNQTSACAESSILHQHRKPTANSHRKPIARPVRRFLFRLAPQPVSPVVPADRPPACAAGIHPSSVPADRFWFAPESVLLGLAFNPSPGLRHDPSLQLMPSMLLSARAAACIFWLASDRLRLAPVSDLSAHRLFQLPACAAN